MAPHVPCLEADHQKSHIQQMWVFEKSAFALASSLFEMCRGALSAGIMACRIIERVFVRPQETQLAQPRDKDGVANEAISEDYIESPEHKIFEMKMRHAVSRTIRVLSDYAGSSIEATTSSEAIDLYASSPLRRLRKIPEYMKPKN